MNLKRIRVGVSISVFMVFFLMFFGSKTLVGVPSDAVQFFQFLPSIVLFLQEPAKILGYGFLVVIILGFLFGRVYCSFLCPLGILQDFFIFVSRKVGIRREHAPLPSFSMVRYAFLILTTISASLGSLVLVNLLDPYGLFGRITDHLFKSVAILLNNVTSDVLVSFDYYGLYTKAQHGIPPFLFGVTLFFFLLILVFSFLYGRAYCTIFCPVGTLLGLISRHSLFKFVMDKGTCKSCGTCEVTCKSGCMDIERSEIDSARCVACFNCLTACKQTAIKYAPQPRVTDRNDLSAAKRRALAQSAILCTAVARLFSPMRLSYSSTRSTTSTPVTPPGSGSISNFTGTCTACHLCISACKTHVLSPSLFGYGLSGFLQPALDFKAGHCDFNCNECGQVCPTGSISPLELKQKQRVQIGTASLNESLCVVYINKKYCGACGEACPTFAITPKGQEHHFAPVVDKDYCIGCGACEKACPTNPKAIFVTANIVHAQAKVREKRPLPKQEAGFDENEPFPF